MPVYNIPVKWSMWGIHEIEADSKEEAIHLAQTVMPLPFMQDFIDNSAEVMMDKIEEIKK